MTNLISTNKIATNVNSRNGISANGISRNGISPNGISANGISANGISANGISTNLISTNVIAAMEKEQEYLKQVREKVEEDIRQDQKDKLLGKLRIQRKGNSIQYYHVGAVNSSKNQGTLSKSISSSKSLSSSKSISSSKSLSSSEQFNSSGLSEPHPSSQQKQTYIPKKNITLARNLAQRDYDNKLIQEIDSRQKLVNRFLKEYPHASLEEIYVAMNEYRKNLIAPIIETDEQYAKNWLNAPYIKKIVGEDVPEIFTENGERVRSKSEKMIADKLKQLGVPYRYEAPLRLGRNCVIHPDFTVLNVRLRKEYYYEHFGMMDNPEYVENAMKRIELYEKKGIFPGGGLLFSWETLLMPLNMKVVGAMIEKFLI